MYRNGRSISHGGEAAESTTSARSPVASSTKPGNECRPRNRSPRQKIYKRQSIDSFEAAQRPGGGQAEARGPAAAKRTGGQADGRPSGREVKQPSDAETHCHGICVWQRSSNWEPPRGARRRFRPSGDHRNVTYPFALDGLFQSEGWVKRMSTVRDFELIRRKSLVEKQSIRSIAKELRRSRRSAPRA
jgi:hypothetical protein